MLLLGLAEDCGRSANEATAALGRAQRPGRGAGEHRGKTHLDPNAMTSQPAADGSFQPGPHDAAARRRRARDAKPHRPEQQLAETDHIREAEMAQYASEEPCGWLWE